MIAALETGNYLDGLGRVLFVAFGPMGIFFAARFGYRYWKHIHRGQN